jgi:hypothetical protein
MLGRARLHSGSTQPPPHADASLNNNVEHNIKSSQQQAEVAVQILLQ